MESSIDIGGERYTLREQLGINGHYIKSHQAQDSSGRDFYVRLFGLRVASDDGYIIGDAHDLTDGFSEIFESFRRAHLEQPLPHQASWRAATVEDGHLALVRRYYPQRLVEALPPPASVQDLQPYLHQLAHGADAMLSRGISPALNLENLMAEAPAQLVITDQGVGRLVTFIEESYFGPRPTIFDERFLYQVRLEPLKLRERCLFEVAALYFYLRTGERISFDPQHEKTPFVINAQTSWMSVMGSQLKGKTPTNLERALSAEEAKVVRSCLTGDKAFRTIRALISALC